MTITTGLLIAAAAGAIALFVTLYAASRVFDSNIETRMWKQAYDVMHANFNYHMEICDQGHKNWGTPAARYEREVKAGETLQLPTTESPTGVPQ